MSQGKRLEELPAVVVQEIEPLFFEMHTGYLTDTDFVVRLEKITSEQADAVISPIVESVAEGNAEIRKSFHRILWLQNREDAPKPYLDEIKLEYNNIKDIYRKMYRHISAEEIREKLVLVLYSIGYKNALALSRLRQRILHYVAVVKSSGDEVTSTLIV